MSHQRFVNSTMILGLAILMLGFGFYLNSYFEEAIMYTASLVYVLLAYRAFTDDN